MCTFLPISSTANKLPIETKHIYTTEPAEHIPETPEPFKNTRPEWPWVEMGKKSRVENNRLLAWFLPSRGQTIRFLSRLVQPRRRIAPEGHLRFSVRTIFLGSFKICACTSDVTSTSGWNLVWGIHGRRRLVVDEFYYIACFLVDGTCVHALEVYRAVFSYLHCIAITSITRI